MEVGGGQRLRCLLLLLLQLQLQIFALNFALALDDACAGIASKPGEEARLLLQEEGLLICDRLSEGVCGRETHQGKLVQPLLVVRHHLLVEGVRALDPVRVAVGPAVVSLTQQVHHVIVPLFGVAAPVLLEPIQELVEVLLLHLLVEWQLLWLVCVWRQWWLILERRRRSFCGNLLVFEKKVSDGGRVLVGHGDELLRLRHVGDVHALAEARPNLVHHSGVSPNHAGADPASVGQIGPEGGIGVRSVVVAGQGLLEASPRKLGRRGGRREMRHRLLLLERRAPRARDGRGQREKHRAYQRFLHTRHAAWLLVGSFEVDGTERRQGRSLRCRRL
mmetsp:Transcript_4459/g.11378  ORF Transcript_4459/g.11378 Transcript_4459/m.11378 type:complete len:333 (+) Transcript_4459:197-1195(+)